MAVADGLERHVRQFISDHMKRNGITQRRAAKEIGVPKDTVHRWLRSSISIVGIEKLCSVCGLHPVAVFETFPLPDVSTNEIRSDEKRDKYLPPCGAWPHSVGVRV